MPSLAKSFAVLLLLVTVLGGCKIELYSNLEENEANDMLAVLLENGIDADKTVEKGIATIQVEKVDVAEAINLLRSRGLPREKFVGMDEIFQKEGLISTPAEERARYIYALSQELSRTLLDIDGVTGARVHLVLPENDPRNDTAVPSSAAVLIKHNEDQLVGDLVPQIKELVTNSIEGLSYDKVSVVLFETREFAPDQSVPKYTDILGMRVDPQSLGEIWMLLGTIAVLLLVIIGGSAFLIYTQRRGRTQTDHGS